MKILARYCALAILPVGVAFAAADNAHDRTGECNSAFEPASGSYQFLQEQTLELYIAADAKVGEIYYTRLPIFDETNPQ